MEITADFPDSFNNEATSSVESNIADLALPRIEEERTRPTPLDISQVHAVILAGGGDENNPLTRHRARPALPLAGSYRIIDFPLSNVINSSIREISVLTQWNSHSLNTHLSNSYPPEVFGALGTKGSVGVLPCYQTPNHKAWSHGSADSVRFHMEAGNLDGRPGSPDPEAYLIVSGEAVYEMDYQALLDAHNAAGADVTIASYTVRAEEASALGVMATTDDGAVYRFHEKPSPEKLRNMLCCASEATLDDCKFSASMGVYLFSRRALVDLLSTAADAAAEGGECAATAASTSGAEGGAAAAFDFGYNIIPTALERGYTVMAHPFDGFWQPVRSLREWFTTNLSMTESGSAAEHMVYSQHVFSRPRFLPPSSFSGGCECTRAMFADGCVIRASHVEESVVGPTVKLAEGVKLRRTVISGQSEMLLGADRHSTPDIGARSELCNCVMDSGARVGADCRLVNEAGVEHLDRSADGYVIEDGIIVVLKDAVIPDGTVI